MQGLLRRSRRGSGRVRARAQLRRKVGLGAGVLLAWVCAMYFLVRILTACACGRVAGWLGGWGGGCAGAPFVLPAVFVASMFSPALRRSTDIIPDNIILAREEEAWVDVARIDFNVVVRAVMFSFIPPPLRLTSHAQMRGANFAQNKRPTNIKAIAGAAVQLLHEPDNGLKQESAYIVKQGGGLYVRGWVHREQAPFLCAAANLGAVFRDVVVSDDDPADIASGSIAAGGIALVKDELRLVGQAVCQSAVASSVCSALGGLVFNK